ncbi:MAG: phenylacetate--CoA ligase family protein, partial [Anaerolineae bacterium]
PDPDSSGPFHRINLAERQIYLSAFHINAANTPVYIKALRDHAIRWMTGYAHAIYDLAAWTLAGGIDAPHLDAVVTTSEPVTPAMRQTIESAFSTRVFEEYAALENAFLVCECEYGRLHINPDAGLIEVVDADFQPVPPGEVGEVLATGFMRPGQPLIRYRVGDRAVLSAEPCPCGRHMPVVETVLGRVEDTVIGPDGRRVMRFHGVFLDQPHIREGQIVQQTVDHILVRVVPAPGFGPNDEAEIRRRVRQRLGERVTVSVQCVEHIARTPAGKFRAVVSTLD